MGRSFGSAERKHEVFQSQGAREKEPGDEINMGRQGEIARADAVAAETIETDPAG
jgi:aconitase B